MTFLTELREKMDDNKYSSYRTGKNYKLYLEPMDDLFQPFQNLAEFKQVIKTILVAPLLGLASIIKGISDFIKNILLFAISILCMDMVLAQKAIIEFMVSIQDMILPPYFAINVTIRSIVLLVTKGIATVCSVNSNDDENENTSNLNP